MDTRNISGPVDVTTQWDIQVEYRFDRSGGLSDVVRVRRGGPVNLRCSMSQRVALRRLAHERSHHPLPLLSQGSRDPA